MRKLFLIVVLLFFACNIGTAQEYVISLQNWGLKEGLSHRQISNVFVDSRGIVWLSTPNGLNRFDGRNFKWYTRENSKLPFNDVFAILYEDSNHNFLLEQELTRKRGLFNPITGYCKYPVDLMGDTEHFAMSDTMRFWNINTSNQELKSLNHRTFFTMHDSLLRFYTYKDGKLKLMGFPYATECLLESDYFLIINNCRVNDTQFYLYRANVKGETTRKLKLPGRVINYVSFTSQKGVLINIEGSNYYVDSNFNITDLKSSFRFKYDAFYTGVADLCFSAGIIFRTDGTVVKNFVAERIGDFKSKQRFYLQEYAAGRAWIANDFGLHLLTIGQNKFKRYFYDSAFNGDVRNSYRAIAKVDGKLLVNEEFSGLFSQAASGSEELCRVYNKLDLLSYGGNENYALCKTSGGRIITSIGSHLMELDLAFNKFRLLNKGQLLANCWSIFEAQPGVFLLGTEKGLKKMDMRSGTPYFTPERKDEYELQGSFVLHSARSRNGDIWVSTNTGLYQYNLATGVVGKYSETESGSHYLPAVSFRHFYEDAHGNMWLATTNGLLYWDRRNNKTKLYTRTEGLSNNNIYAVYGDKLGRLWMSSDYGLMRFNPENGRVNTYLTEDGITHNEFNRISHYQDSNGIIYFGSLNGITALDPSDFNDKAAGVGAKLAITDFLQFDGASNKLLDRTASILEHNRIDINPDDRFFTLDYALLNYIDPSNTVYYWKIDGIDTGWTITKEHSLRLSRLPYGEWTLRIKAQGADGRWSANQLAIAVNVVKPFYLRLWFLLLCAVTISGIVIVVYRMRIKRLLNVNVMLERAIAEATAELEVSLAQKDMLLGDKEILLKEIHHRVKNNLQVISALLYLQGNTMEDGQAKNAIVESTGRVKSISLIHQQLYQTHEMSSVELYTFLKDLFTQVELLFNSPKNRIQMNNDLPRTRFDIDTAVPLGLLLNELLTNSFKYAFPNKVTGFINITLSEPTTHNYILTYKDSGPGLPVELLGNRGKTLGLRMIDRLSKQMGGNCSYAPETQTFTIIFLDDTGRKLKD